MSNKVYRPVVVLLLLVLVAVQVWNVVDRNTVSEACQAAINRARDVTSAGGAALTAMNSSYDEAVYGVAANINQQILFANEFQFLAIQQLIRQDAALLSLALNCQ